MSNDSDDGAKLTAVESNSSNKPKEVKDRPEQRKLRGSTCSKGKQSRSRSKHDNCLGVKGGRVSKKLTKSRKFSGAATYQTVFQKAWRNKFDFISPCPVKNTVQCNICLRSIRVGHQGAADIARHAKSESHKKYAAERKSQLTSNLKIKPRKIRYFVLN